MVQFPPTQHASTLRVAAAQPVTIGGDLVANVLAHADAVRRCAAQVVVFPEMSLTGYSMDAAVVDADDPVLGPLVQVCAETGSVALVGAPVRHGAGRGIGVIAVGTDGVEIVYRKMSVDSSESPFLPGTSTGVVEVDGWRIGLGICKDTRIDEQILATAAAGIDVYAAGLVHAPDEVDQFEERALRIIGHAAVPVVFAGFAGPTGGGYPQTCGGSAIWDRDGTRLVQAGNRPGDVVTWELRR